MPSPNTGRRRGSRSRRPSGAGSVSHLVGPGRTDPETVKRYLISIKGTNMGAVATRFCRHDGTLCRPGPAQPPIVPARNQCWKPVFGTRVLSDTGEVG